MGDTLQRERNLELVPSNINARVDMFAFFVPLLHPHGLQVEWLEHMLDHRGCPQSRFP